ncbi:uncharacterized protein LOC117933477 isoform X3 [Vitis riparia]|uniref:uncharacterized protein LOC117933477 isoform X3 n=1 Tax=Vitis riparia TaxID=96939 RepID=UPI00155AD98B|nr:uncharacterized protein LOC117933477 isoform X3 [Vitis riparia]
MEISGQVSYDVAATYAWKLYEAFQLAKIIQKGFSHMVEKVELIENDGGVGTILELTSVGGQVRRSSTPAIFAHLKEQDNLLKCMNFHNRKRRTKSGDSHYSLPIREWSFIMEFSSS